MADVERTGIETDVTFTVKNDEHRYHLQDKQTGRLDARTDGELKTAVTLRGSRTRSPILYPARCSRSATCRRARPISAARLLLVVARPS